MKGQRTLVTEELYEYIVKNYVAEDEQMKKLHNLYEKYKIPKISITPEQGKFIYILAKMICAENILEIGTLIGYSTLWLNKAINTKGKILSIEVSRKHYNIAKDFFDRMELKSIDLRLGKAMENLALIQSEAPYDMIFIDADKENYPLYFKTFINLVRKGGIIAFDNTLSKGRVLDLKETKKGVIGIKTLNEIMGKCVELDSILVPIADGISFGVKK